MIFLFPMASITAAAVATMIFFTAVAHADIALPTHFECSPPGCSGSAVPLPVLNGIQGVEVKAGEGFQGTNTPALSFDVIGPLSGGTLALGTAIPFTFSFFADFTNPGGITAANLGFQTIVPDPSVTAFPTYQFSQNIKNCAPFLNTHW